MSLDPIAKEVWCEALRSGEFSQRQGCLKRDGRFCCLGVAAEIFPALTKNPIAQDLSLDSLDLLGLTTDQQYSLIRMNDDGESFAEIADYIERKL